MTPDLRRLGAALAAGLALAVAGASCSETADTLDRAGTERAVERVVGGRIGPDVDRVRCPQEIPRGRGRRFSCRAVLADEVGDVRLRVRQADDDGRLEVELLDAVVDRRDVADDLRRTLVSTYLREFTVDCGDPGPRVVAPGTTFTCDAADPAGEREVEVTVTDAAGTLSYDVGRG
ncbi:MAG TPA: DUF4333 domain-containing protein [Aquihabitans sp.]|nr:DUF4333 domain-containing protein [Aquihabitans sp.]